jgi:hypothetical protein
MKPLFSAAAIAAMVFAPAFVSADTQSSTGQIAQTPSSMATPEAPAPKNNHTRAAVAGPDRFKKPKPEPEGVKYIEFHENINPSVYNAYNNGVPGAKAGLSFGSHGAIELPPITRDVDFMISEQADQYAYPHTASGQTGFCPGSTGCVTTFASNPGQTYVPGFNAVDSDISGHLGIGFRPVRIYAAIAYIQDYNNYGAPNMQGFGYGIEKLADVDRVFAPYGSVYYYPHVGAGTSTQYNEYTYQVGLAYNLFAVGIPGAFLDAGFSGNRMDQKINAAIDQVHHAAYAGVGIHI